MNFDQIPQQPNITLKEINDPIPDNFVNFFNIKNEKIKEFLSKFFWNCPKAFIQLARLFKLLEILPKKDYFKTLGIGNAIDSLQYNYAGTINELEKEGFSKKDTDLIDNLIIFYYPYIFPILKESIPSEN